MTIKPELLIEASLFSAGKPLSIDELSEALTLGKETIEKNLKKLITIYSKKDSALEIAKVGDKYNMLVKPALAEHIKSLAQMEIPAKVLKTAALIGYHQPIKQSDLQEMFGSKVYDHVKVLAELGLISRRHEGRTIILTTTAQFAEYFGIATIKRDEIKKWLSEKVQELEKMEEKNRKQDTDNKS